MACYPARALALLAAGALCAAQAGAFQPGDDWSLRVPSDDQVVYRGAVNLDAAGGGAGAMLYPAAGVGGLVAAIITHGVIVEATKNAERTRLQENADRVLLPFREQLADFRYPRLLQMALDRVPGAGRSSLVREGASRQEWLFASTPVFSLTQDRRALILDNELSLFKPGEASLPAYTITVRVVSRPREIPATDWSAPEGNANALQEESAQLVAHSLQLAMRHAARPAPAAAMKTMRYPEGGAERIERAQPLEMLCGRMVLRNLRGWLLSVPVGAESVDTGGCAAEPAGWR